MAVIRLLLAMSAILLMRLADGKECGCWGSNGVYLHYRPPATGWYHSTSDKYLYQRNVTVYGGKIHYLLEYKPKGKRHTRNMSTDKSRNWVLFERRVEGISPLGVTFLISNWKVKNISISCPDQCSCRNIKIIARSCWQISGNYTRRDLLQNQNSTSNWTKIPLEQSPSVPRSSPRNYSRILRNVHVSEVNVTSHTKTDRVSSKNEIKSVLEEQSNCLLRELAKCIDNMDDVNSQSSNVHEENNMEEEDNCRHYTKVLAHVNHQESKIQSPEEYVMRTQKKEYYILSQDKGGDFWWIGVKDQLYAVSNEAGPCPDQLPPNSNWTFVDDKQKDTTVELVCQDRDMEGD